MIMQLNLEMNTLYLCLHNYKDGEFKANAMASVWAPDITFKNLLGVDITITGHVGSIGGKLNIANVKFDIGAAYGYGSYIVRNEHVLINIDI